MQNHTDQHSLRCTHKTLKISIRLYHHHSPMLLRTY